MVLLTSRIIFHHIFSEYQVVLTCSTQASKEMPIVFNTFHHSYKESNSRRKHNEVVNVKAGALWPASRYNTLAGVTSWKRIYDNQRATDLRASRDSFFLPAPPPLSLFYAEFLQANLDFPISGRDLHPLYARGLASSTRTHSSLQQYIFPRFSLFLPYLLRFLFARYIRVTSFSIFFPCGTCFLLPFVRPLKKTVWQRPSPSRNGFSHVRARTRSRDHVVLAVSNACATSNRSSKSAGRRGLIRERRIGCPDFVVRCALCTHTLLRRATWIRAFNFSSTPCTIKSYVNLPPNIHAIPFGAFLRKFRSTAVISPYSLRRNFYKISFTIVQSNFW